MPCCLPPFRISAKILCRNNRKRPYDKEQAILLLSANKNCQLTDDRILLTEKTFILIFRVITIADSLLTSRMTPCRLLSSERSRECFEGKEGSGYCYGPIEFYMPKYISMPRCPPSSLSCTQWRKSTISIILFIRSILFLFLLKTKESTTCNH